MDEDRPSSAFLIVPCRPSLIHTLSSLTSSPPSLPQVLGKGSFGKVMLVRFKGSRELHAMKTLRKEALIRRSQLAHTSTERYILQHIHHPFLMKLSYAFQTKEKLYMVSALPPPSLPSLPSLPPLLPPEIRLSTPFSPSLPLPFLAPQIGGGLHGRRRAVLLVEEGQVWGDEGEAVCSRDHLCLGGAAQA